MRLWTIHPKYLNQQHLSACWREGLWAASTLQGFNNRNHSQLQRFWRHSKPVDAICFYLHEIWKEAYFERGYVFNVSKIPWLNTHIEGISVTRGQVVYEACLLEAKTGVKINDPEVNDLFDIVEGELEEWEKILPFTKYKLKAYHQYRLKMLSSGYTVTEFP